MYSILQFVVSIYSNYTSLTSTCKSVYTLNLILFPMIKYYEKDYKHVQLEENLCEMQLELENLVWDRKILEDQLQAAIRERKILESMFAELEDEHDKAIEKIELLEREVNIKSSTSS